MSFTLQKTKKIKESYQFSSIQSYDFPSSLNMKLIQEHNWTSEYTERVLKEYVRFIHLTMIGDQEMTPSQIVDLAWHMHLTFTEDYWERMMPILPRVLHHKPCKDEDPSADKVRYEQQYQATLQLYHQEFGESPPDDIWGVDQPIKQAIHQEGFKMLGCFGKIFLFLLIVIASTWVFGVSALGFAVIVATIIIVVMNTRDSSSGISIGSSGGSDADGGDSSSGCGGCGGGCGG